MDVIYTATATAATIPVVPEPNLLQSTNNLHYAPLQGIGSWQRQLIAVTCIAEHA